jgi:hypothetical protein
MPQYFLTLPHDSASEPTMATMDPAELEAAMAAVGTFNSALQEAGALVTLGGLEPPSAAITVDATSGTPVRTQAPFVEASQYVGGFWVIEAADMEAALVWAEQGAAALRDRIEVRALQEIPE